MCLAIPGKIIEINNETAIVKYNDDLKRTANCSLINCKLGDYVIIQAGFITQIVSKKETKEMYKLL